MNTKQIKSKLDKISVDNNLLLDVDYWKGQIDEMYDAEYRKDFKEQKRIEQLFIDKGWMNQDGQFIDLPEELGVYYTKHYA